MNGLMLLEKGLMGGGSLSCTLLCEGTVSLPSRGWIVPRYHLEKQRHQALTCQVLDLDSSAYRIVRDKFLFFFLSYPVSFNNKNGLRQ
jgi:hypothetical protein